MSKPQARTKLRLHALGVVLLLLAGAIASRAQTAAPLVFAPTTTLAIEAGNNTSASDAYSTSLAGNAVPGNVSKLPLRTLLYPGATTKIYAHLMAWFAGPGHLDVGYASDDPAQVTKQVEDMISRGIDGVIIDWYGPGPNRTASATALIKQQAELHPGFVFAVQEDKGALKQCAGAGACDPTDRLLQHLKFIHENYTTSPAYLRIEGRAVVLFFDLDLHYQIDWQKIANNLPEDFLFIFQHQRGFRHEYSGGSFGWIRIDQSNADDWGQSYLDGFYRAAQNALPRHTFGAVYRGFDDSFAGWSKNRLVNQNCGATWLNTFTEIRRQYSLEQPLENLQLVTWNDYEEGTEIESGIDNCASISAWRSGGTLHWRTVGQLRPLEVAANDLTAGSTAPLLSDSADDTLDHFSVYISTDGVNLMALTDVAPGENKLDLSTLNLPPDSYYIYVKMQAKPGFLNHISSAVKYTVR